MYKEEVNERDYIEGKKNYYWHASDERVVDDYYSRDDGLECDGHHCESHCKPHCDVCQTGATGVTRTTGDQE
ncbi:hypothetical protein [Clostridium sp.]|uniref:hypothetical protein n=1 Tax=Clostridium sp. TaxID=1506 RepID=UPI002604E321|nr:hypothetical protein [uncultured Clostridium sp.]